DFQFLLCVSLCYLIFFFFSSRRRHTRSKRDWSSDVCSSDLSYAGGRGHTCAVGYSHVTSRRTLHSTACHSPYGKKSCGHFWRRNWTPILLHRHRGGTTSFRNSN